MCVKNNTIIYVARASNSKRDCDTWSLLLLAATVRSFVHMLLGISDRNTDYLRAFGSWNVFDCIRLKMAASGKTTPLCWWSFRCASQQLSRILSDTGEQTCRRGVVRHTDTVCFNQQCADRPGRSLKSGQPDISLTNCETRCPCCPWKQQKRRDYESWRSSFRRRIFFTTLRLAPGDL